MANYAFVQNGEVVEWHDKLPINWDNVNGFFKLPTEITVQYGWYPVISNEPKNFNTNKYTLGNRRGIVQDLAVIEEFDLILRPDYEAERNAEAAEQVFKNSLRNTRDQLLLATDWTQLADAPVDKQAWAEYRQKLRDLPAVIYAYNSAVKDCLPQPPSLLSCIKSFY